MDRKILILNWKSYVNLEEALALFDVIKLAKNDSVHIIVCPPYPLLLHAVTFFDGAGISVGAQNVSCFGQGAYTGEVSAQLLKSMGVEYVLVGHSERREIFGEKNSDVLAKVIAAQKEGIIPILCLGESAAQYEAGQTEQAIAKQLKECITKEVNNNLVISYEPVWAIGTGHAATPQIAKANIDYIKNVARKMFDMEIPVLYGGSVKASNIQSLLSILDGALIGSAAVKCDEIKAILEKC